MMVDAGIIKSLVQLLEQPSRAKPQAISLALKVLAILLASSTGDKEAFNLASTGLLSCGGVPVVGKFVVASNNSNDNEQAHSCEWAVAIFYELSTDGTFFFIYLLSIMCFHLPISSYGTNKHYNRKDIASAYRRRNAQCSEWKNNRGSTRSDLAILFASVPGCSARE